jgi:hypothetical protein
MWSERPAPLSSESLLVERLRTWASLYGREISDDAITIWLDIFKNADPRVLALALEKLTAECERMPSPGSLTKQIAIIYDLHPELSKKLQLTHREGTDANGTPCWFWCDEPRVPAYAARDCAEGKAFLKQLAITAGHVSVENAGSAGSSTSAS